MTQDEAATTMKPTVIVSGGRTAGLCAVVFFVGMILQELIVEGANEAFPDLVALPYAITLFQFACCFWLPVLISGRKALETFPRTPSAALPYVSLSLLVFGSTCLATMSVRFVSYPTKIVFKSAKLIPTMAMAGCLLPRQKAYGPLDYAAAVMLCAGAASFGWDSGNHRGGNSATGIALLLAAICCDAVTPNVQQRLMTPPADKHDGDGNGLPTTTTTTTTTTFKVFSPRDLGRLILPPNGLGLSASALMTNANGIGGIGLLLAMAVRGSLAEALGVVREHPVLLAYLVGSGVSLALAVLCYTRLIRESGSVVAVAVATLRKVGTMVMSYLVFPKPLTATHLLGSFLVLGGILLGMAAKRRSN